MKLSEYFEKSGETAETFAPKIKRSKKQVYDYLAGRAAPRGEVLVIIMDVTNGDVTANDFLPA
jgi:hypothetical protein